MDSNATEHAVDNLSYLADVEKTDDIQLTVADGTEALAKRKDNILVMVREQLILLRNVYYVPDLHMNVLLYARLNQRQNSTNLVKGKCFFYYRKEQSRYF